jgi:hypothetical protein
VDFSIVLTIVVFAFMVSVVYLVSMEKMLNNLMEVVVVVHALSDMC